MAGYSGRPLAEKLGIKPGSRILAIHAPTAYRKILGPLPDNVVVLRRTVTTADLIHLFVSRRADIEKELPRQRRLMADSAVLWVSWPKKASGVVTDVTEDVVRKVALPLGLVDTKVCAVDDVWSGLKLVVRRELRKTVLSLLPDGAAQDRMPPIPPERMTKAQKRAAAEFVANRKAEVFGPFVPLLRSPEVMLRAMAMGDYLRYRSTLPPRVNELVILITSRHWTQQYEWNLHYADGIKAGLNPTIANAIAERRRPEGMAEDEEIAYELSTELLDERSVSDRTYARAISKFGEQGTMDMVGVVGYYTLLAMVLNTARTPLPAGAKPVLMPFPK